MRYYDFFMISGSKLREASLFNDEEPSIGMEPGPSKEQSHQFEPPMMDDNDGFGPTIGGDFGENSETGGKNLMKFFRTN